MAPRAPIASIPKAGNGRALLFRRLPKQDIAADIGITNQGGAPLLVIDNAAFRDGDGAMLLGSRICGFYVADLQAGVIGVDVLEFDRRGSLAFIHGKRAQLDAHVIVGRRLWEPPV